MNEQIVLNLDVEQSLRQLKFNQRQPKKYILSKTIPVYPNNSGMNSLQERFRGKFKAPQYFTSILKQQKKNMFINLFLRKLKSAIVLRTPPNHPFLHEENKSIKQDQIQLHVPKIVQLSLLVIWSLHSFSLLILNSLAIIFSQIQCSNNFNIFIVASCLIQCFQMCSKFIMHMDYQQNKLTKIRQIRNKYLERQFWIDLSILLGLVIHFIPNYTNGGITFFRLLIFLKIRSLSYMVEHLQITLIENEYRQQIWSLIKVFLFNFIFAHILTLALLQMARLNEDQNWLVYRNLYKSDWSQKYIWGYYWATTIMLTVGFGDLTPQNSREAMCMIFIQTMSCIVLAYNINCVGTIIQKIRSYQQQKISNLKTFNHINQKSQFSNETKTRIMNYIKESTQIRRNFNLGEQKKFIESLPQSFKSDILKEMNRHIWNGMMFFQNLSESTLLKLSITIQKKLAHPGEIVYFRGSDIDIIVFNGGGFGYSYNNGNSVNNGRIMQPFNVGLNKFQVASMNFLLGKRLKYDIKCTDYSVVYRLSTEQLAKILIGNTYDSEYFSMIKDKDKFLLNQYQLVECEICSKQRHSVFKCPRLHYMPLRDHVIRKYKEKYYSKIFDYSSKRKNMTQHTLLNIKSNRRDIYSTRQFLNNYRQIYKTDKLIQSSLLDQSCQINEKTYRNSTRVIDLSLRNNSNSKVKVSQFYEKAFDELKSRIDNMMQLTKFEWDIEVDLAFNYKFYFRKYNSDQIANWTVKKNKNNTPQVYERTRSKYGYRKTQKS